MKRFRRNANRNFCIVVGIIGIIVMIYVRLVLLADNQILAKVYLLAIIVLTFWVLEIAKCIMRPDFEYEIRLEKDSFIIIMKENDRRVFKKDIKLISRTRKYIILDDGTARISLPYNLEVLEFFSQNIPSLAKYFG